MRSRRSELVVVLVGVAAGVASGLLGVGGGIVMVPLLVMTGLSQHRAHATSLAAIVPIAVVGAITYAVEGQVDYGVAGLLAAGSLIGAPLGARAMARAPERTLKMLFGALMLGVAVSLVVL